MMKIINKKEFIMKTGDPYGSLNYTTLDIKKDRLFYNKNKGDNSPAFSIKK